MHLLNFSELLHLFQLSNVLIVVLDFNIFNKTDLNVTNGGGFLRDNSSFNLSVFIGNDTKNVHKLLEDFLKSNQNVSRFVIEFSHPQIKQIADKLTKLQYQTYYFDFYYNNVSLFEIIVNPKPVIFVGWFWRNLDQEELLWKAKYCLSQVLSIRDIIDEFKAYLKKKNINGYWTFQKKRLHVTSMYLGLNASEEAQEYLKNVSKMFNKKTEVRISGLLLTPKTFSGHAELPESDRWMFDPTKQDLFKLLPHVTLAVAPNVEPVQSGIDQLPVQRLISERGIPKRTFRISAGIVQDWGDLRFYLMLKKPLIYDIIFLAH